MGRPKNETVARYHKNHFKAYKVNFRKNEDADLIEYALNSEIPVSELFRQAFRLYMESEERL